MLAGHMELHLLMHCYSENQFPSTQLQSQVLEQIETILGSVKQSEGDAICISELCACYSRCDPARGPCNSLGTIGSSNKRHRRAQCRRQSAKLLLSAIIECLRSALSIHRHSSVPYGMLLHLKSISALRKMVRAHVITRLYFLDWKCSDITQTRTICQQNLFVD